MNLNQKHCAPCEGDYAPLEGAELQKYMEEVKDWAVIENKLPGGETIKKIKKEFKFKDFKEAMVFVNKVANISESEGHHPDIYIFYNRVNVELWTHAIGGLSENDFILASKIDVCE